jgi:hypothetical protein
MQNQTNTPIIAEPNINPIVPAKWKKPELFKTDFENTESGKFPGTTESAWTHVS